MIRRAAVTALLLPGFSAHAFDAWLLTGLDVATEQVHEAVAVDGAMFTIQRATGADVPELAKRIESQWHRQRSEVRPLHQGEWTMRTRMRGPFSEVLQWRTTNRGHELLWSSLQSDVAPAFVPANGIVLPARCVWGRSVHGRSAGNSYLQRSARCSLSAVALQSTLQASLPTQGWQVRTHDRSGLLLDRPGAEGLLSFTALEGGSSSWLIWLRVEREDRP